MRKQKRYALIIALSGLLMGTVFTNVRAQTDKHYLYAVYFESDKYNLNETAKQKLDKLIQEVKASTDYKLEILANTDADGSNVYNDVLSEKRGKSVETYLSENGISVSKCKAEAKGKREPVYDNSTKEGKAGNRRVDINISLVKYDNIKQLVEAENRRAMQVFVIEAERENIVKGREGSLITIPANAFVTNDGKPVYGKVIFQLQEAYKPEKIFFAGLNTQSDNSLLETGGMLKLGAIQYGQNVVLRKDKSIEIKMPTKKADTSMQLFYGEKNTENKINWKATGQQSKFGDIKIDMGPLLRINIASTVKPELPELTLPTRPAYPLFRKRPIMPREPETIEYQANLLEMIFRSKHYLAKQTEKLNSTYINDYDRRMDNYIEALKKYLTDSADFFSKALQVYKRDSVQYVQHLSYNAEMINKYIKEYKEYLAINELNREIRCLQRTHVRKHTVFYPYFGWCFYIGYYNTYSQNWALYKKYLGVEIKYNDKDYKLEIKPNCLWRSNYCIELEGGVRIPVWGDTFYWNKIQELTEKYKLKSICDTLNDEVAAAAAKSNTLDLDDVSYYAYSVNQINWINCDRFVNNPNPVAVNVKETEDANIMIKINEINSYMTAYNNGNLYTTKNIPKDKAITIVAIKIKDGKLKMAVRRTLTGLESLYELQYKDCTLEQFKDYLKGV